MSPIIVTQFFILFIAWVIPIVILGWVLNSLYRIKVAQERTAKTLESIEELLRHPRA